VPAFGRPEVTAKPGEPRSSDHIREFFDRQHETNQYASLKRMTLGLDIEAARHLNSHVRGAVLSIGGVWDFFSWTDRLDSLTVLDLSSEMLKAYCPKNAIGVVGDLYSHDFPPESFDSIVFPLMLHHTPQESWRSSQSRVEEAMDRAHRWLRKDGHVLILEYCPQRVWSAVQRGMLPLTKRFLARFDQPLVVMHPVAFYERVLTERFGSCEAKRVDPEGFNYWKWYPVFMSIRWLRVPLAIYPKLHVITAPARD
jgi:Methyltransferase domain